MKYIVNILIITFVLFASCNQTPKTEPQRAAFLEGAPNFRDLGGYDAADNKQTIWRKLFRSQNLAKLTNDDVTKLKEMGIKTVIDFRDDNEVQNEPSRLPEGVNIIRIPISAGNNNDSIAELRRLLMNGEADSLQIIAFMEYVNRNFAIDFAPQYRDFFQILLRPDAYPVVFHCAAGKDRTGFASAIILTALGVDWNTIMSDYLLTNTHYIRQGVISSAAQDARPSYLNAARNEVITKYGSLDNYLQQALGVGDAEKMQLKKHLLN